MDGDRLAAACGRLGVGRGFAGNDLKIRFEEDRLDHVGRRGGALAELAVAIGHAYRLRAGRVPSRAANASALVDGHLGSTPLLVSVVRTLSCHGLGVPHTGLEYLS